MTVERLKREFPGAVAGKTDSEVQDALSASLRGLQPTEEEQSFEGEGAYNNVLLEEPAHHLVSVTDGTGEVDCALRSNGVRKSEGNFSPPIVVVYVTVEAQRTFERELVQAVRHRLRGSE